MMIAAPTAPPAPEFTLHGELTPALISALAALLISHARRELAAERDGGRADEGDQHGGERE